MSASSPPLNLGGLADREFAAVLFDLDGTLIDSTAAVVRSWVRWAQEYDVDPRSLQGKHGVPAVGVMAGLVPPDQVPQALRRIEEIEVADVEGILVLPGAAEALAGLPPGRAAIVTSCTGPLAAARIAATGLIAPTVVVTASQVTQGKPDPEPFLLGASLLGVDARDCLVVEDAPAGLTAALAAGAARLAVTTTHSRTDLSADAVVADLGSVRFVAGPGGIRVRPA